MFGFGFNPNKLKPHLKMAVHRLQIAANKKSNSIKNQKREISRLLSESPPKEEKARIRAEALIREDNTIEAYEILELQCELLHERMRLIESQKECPGDLISCVSTLIWASDRVDVPELVEVRNQLTKKYGKPFVEAAMKNEGGVLNDRVVHKLSVKPPSAFLVMSYLREIAAQFGVDYQPTDEVPINSEVAMAAPTGFSVPMAPGSDFGQIHAQERMLPNAQQQAFQQQQLQNLEAEIAVNPTAGLPDGWTYTQEGLLAAPAAAVVDANDLPTESVAKVATAPVELSFETFKGGPDTEAKPENESIGEAEIDAEPKYDDLAARFNALKR